jgi:hypothetical protein
MATKPQAKKVAEVEPLTVRVLCAVTIGAKRYSPNDLIEGMPADLLEQFQASLDAHPAAVALARKEGGKAVAFEA